MLPDNVTDLLNKIAKSEGFSSFEIKSEAGSSHGDNFLGVLTAVTISGTKGNNGQSKPEEIHLIFKTPPSNEMRKKNFKSHLVFDREIHMYGKVLPAIVKFQKEKGLSEAESFVSFPKVYACDKNLEDGSYTLIMENLRAKHFEMWPKDKVIPLDHELFVMRELAKFHAVSFAMKDQRPDQFEEFKQLKDTFGEVGLHGKLRSFMNRTIDRATEVLKNPEHKRIMQNFRKRYVETMDEFLIGASSKEFAIVGHGDCWNNNFLYQHSDKNKTHLKAICLLDWQLSRYGPPVLDLLYNIFSATDHEFRVEHYDTILKTYHMTLSESIRRLGSDPEKLYSWDTFQQQLRKFGEFALLCGPMIIQMTVASANDIGSLDEYAELVEKGENPDLLKPFDEETQMKYSQLINGLVTDLISYRYINDN